MSIAQLLRIPHRGGAGLSSSLSPGGGGLRLEAQVPAPVPGPLGSLFLFLAVTLRGNGQLSDPGYGSPPAHSSSNLGSVG